MADFLDEPVTITRRQLMRAINENTGWISGCPVAFEDLPRVRR